MSGYKINKNISLCFSNNIKGVNLVRNDKVVGHMCSLVGTSSWLSSCIALPGHVVPDYLVKSAMKYKSYVLDGDNIKDTNSLFWKIVLKILEHSHKFRGLSGEEQMLMRYSKYYAQYLSVFPWFFSGEIFDREKLFENIQKKEFVQNTPLANEVFHPFHEDSGGRVLISKNLWLLFACRSGLRKIRKRGEPKKENVSMRDYYRRVACDTSSEFMLLLLYLRKVFGAQAVMVPLWKRYSNTTYINEVSRFIYNFTEERHQPLLDPARHPTVRLRSPSEKCRHSQDYRALTIKDKVLYVCRNCGEIGVSKKGEGIGCRARYLINGTSTLQRHTFNTPRLIRELGSDVVRGLSWEERFAHSLTNSIEIACKLIICITDPLTIPNALIITRGSESNYEAYKKGLPKEVVDMDYALYFYSCDTDTIKSFQVTSYYLHNILSDIVSTFSDVDSVGHGVNKDKIIHKGQKLMELILR